jgi:hypothetical protein
MPKLSLSRAWDEAKLLLAREGRLLLAVSLALVVLPDTVFGLIATTSIARDLGSLLLVLTVMILIGLVAQTAIIRLAVGPSTTVGGAIARGFVRLPAVLVAALIVVAALFLFLVMGLVLLASSGLVTLPAAGSAPSAPLVFLMGWLTAAVYAIFQLLVPVAAAESVGPIRMLSRAWELSKGNYWRLLTFALLIFVSLAVVQAAGQFGMGALIALVLGPPHAWSLSALVAALVAGVVHGAFVAVFAVMLARIYFQLSGGSEAQASVPKSGT